MPLRRNVLICCCALTFSAAADTLPLMPWPQQVEQPARAGWLTLTPQLTLQIVGDTLPGAETRWLSRIARQTGWPLLPADQPVEHPTIRIAIAQAVNPVPQPDSDESYQLDVNRDGVLLKANSRFGAMRGMETLLQLIENSAEGTRIPWITIHDKPRFAWRGILIDSARHFMPVRTLKRQIDGIAAARMNVLHWHLTDDQG
ncbi:hypothetical protein BN1182_AE_00850 [Pantoea ananatis]|nr:hypothetical protein BN1182_AE_00850 [Pantoea ananatis]